MSAKQHAVKVGDEYHLSGAASFLMIAWYAYEDFSAKKSEAPSGLRTIVDQMLTMASAGGFARSDLFSTLLSRREESPRMIQLAQEAVNFMGGDDVAIEFIRRAHAAKKGGAQ